MKIKTNTSIIRANKAHISMIITAMNYLAKEFPNSFFVPSTREELEDVLLANNGFILLSMVEKKLAGGVIVIYPNESNHYLSGYDYKESAIIDSIFLDPNFRRRGIASSLMSEALELLEHKKNIYASVALDNIASQNLFSHNGFIIYEKKRLYNNFERYVLLREKRN